MLVFNVAIFVSKILLYVLVSYIICLDIHELGHYFFGKLVRFKIDQISFCFINLCFSSGRINIVLKEKDFFTGKVHIKFDCIKKLMKDSRTKMIMFSLGGEVFSVLFTCIIMNIEGGMFINSLKYVSILVLILAMFGDGVTVIISTISRSYRVSILFIYYFEVERDLEQNINKVIYDEIKFINEKELNIFDCLAISIFSKLCLVYNLKYLNKEPLLYYLDVQNKGQKLNFLGNVGLGFKTLQINAVKSYKNLIE